MELLQTCEPLPVKQTIEKIKIHISSRYDTAGDTFIQLCSFTFLPGREHIRMVLRPALWIRRISFFFWFLPKHRLQYSGVHIRFLCRWTG